MEAVAQSLTPAAPARSWFRDLLKEELAPYPGRLAMVCRMVLTAAIMMVVFMTFQIPDGAYAALYGLIISREDPQTTLSAVKTNIIAFACSTVFVLAGAMLFAGDPMLRLLWVAAALFLSFFGLRVMANYTAAARFGWTVVITIPIWDEHFAPEQKVNGTLWAVGALTLASLATAAIELFFEGFRPSLDLPRSLAERLAAVEELLASYADGRSADQATASKLTRLSMLGTSRLRRVLLRSADSQNDREQMGAVIALVARSVDVAAALGNLNPQFSPNDRKRIETLAQNVAAIRAELGAERAPAPVPSTADSEQPSSIPLLSELERTIGAIPEVFSGFPSLGSYAPLPPPAPPARLFVPDAFTNPEHVRFALKGCLAATLCYVIYLAEDWRGISTAVTTCFLTGLTTVGASHQKQALRISGALVGGALGLLSQVFILPYIESVTGFAILFLMFSFAAGWVVSAGPRISYFGIQVAYAFYLVILSEFTVPTSLTLARDRVVGIVLGLVVMWLVFDQFWGAPAIVEMRRACIGLLRSLARLARTPLPGNLQMAIEQTYALRETVNTGFNNVRSLGDGVWFEFGPTRRQDLDMRRRFLDWMPDLRMLFIYGVTFLKYRLQLPDFELPEPVRLAQRDFESSLAGALDGMANRLEGKPGDSAGELKLAASRLGEAIQNSSSAATGRLVGQQLNTFSALSERITALALSLDSEIRPR